MSREGETERGWSLAVLARVAGAHCVHMDTVGAVVPPAGPRCLLASQEAEDDLEMVKVIPVEATTVDVSAPLAQPGDQARRDPADTARRQGYCREQVIVQEVPEVDLLPPVEEFTAPVYNQVYQDQITADETTENMAEIPVVLEQVIAQEIPEIDLLPPVEEFTAPGYNQVHQEQIIAHETTENIEEIPVVQEQWIVQEIPEVVGPLPPVEESTAPGYNQVHLEQFIAQNR